MSELDPQSRELFRAGRDALRPSLGDRARIREALRTRIEGLSQGPELYPLTNTGNGLGWLSVSALAAAVVVGGVLLTPKSPPPEIPVIPSASAPTRSAPVFPPPVDPAPAPTPSAAPPTVAPRAPEVRTSPKPRSTDNLAEEVALLSRAETELHAGRFSAALELLSKHQRAFPRGILRQERVAARIQALCGLGRVNEATAELARVAPGSLHEGAVQKACGRKAAK